MCAVRCAHINGVTALQYFTIATFENINHSVTNCFWFLWICFFVIIMVISVFNNLKVATIDIYGCYRIAAVLSYWCVGGGDVERMNPLYPNARIYTHINTIQYNTMLSLCVFRLLTNSVHKSHIWFVYIMKSHTCTPEHVALLLLFSFHLFTFILFQSRFGSLYLVYIQTSHLPMQTPTVWAVNEAHTIYMAISFHSDLVASRPR